MSNTEKAQREWDNELARLRKLVAFYKSCALSGEVPTAKMIEEMER